MMNFTANLISTRESDIGPKEMLESKGIQIAGINQIEPMNREIWRWLLIAAILVLMLEWYIYCKRSWA